MCAGRCPTQRLLLKGEPLTSTQGPSILFHHDGQRHDAESVSSSSKDRRISTNKGPRFSQDMTLVDQVLPLSFYLTLLRTLVLSNGLTSADHL